MVLPWLESLPAWGSEAKAAKSPGQPPVRFACLFSGNGFHAHEWWAVGKGRDMELGKVLEPLAPFREKLNFIEGLYNTDLMKQHYQLCMSAQKKLPPQKKLGLI